MGRIRVNVTVDDKLLKQAKKKLELFGGKLSTLFNAYLTDFVKSMDEEVGEKHEELLARVKALEDKVKKLGKD